MKLISVLLCRNGLVAPDGRPLHGYKVTDEELRRMTELLQLRVAVGEVLHSTAAGFVLWASERIRTAFPGGQLTWEFVFDGLSLPCESSLGRELTEQGLLFWKRPLRQSDGGNRAFLYSLLAEGGLPDHALAEAPRYRSALLQVLQEVEAEGALAIAAAEPVAHRAVQLLPQVMRTEEHALLLADLALALIDLRRKLPDDLLPGAEESYLDTYRPNWRRSLPLRLSGQALEALIRPALAVSRKKSARSGSPVRRELRRSADGHGWAGVAAIAEEAIIPRELLAEAARDKRLRLIAAEGRSFFAVPVDDSTVSITPTGASSASLLPISPTEAVVMGIYADGRALGELVLDCGMPPPREAATLWRPADEDESSPEVLIPLSGRGRTRATTLWLLADEALTRVAEPTLEVGEPQPGPGGLLWPISGEGHLRVGGELFYLSTGVDSDSPTPRLVVLGRNLAGWHAEGGEAVHLGMPRLLVSEGDAPLRPLYNPKLRPAGRLLGGQIVAWQEDESTLAQTRLVILPENFAIDMRETGDGQLQIELGGLSPGWHIHVRVGEAVAQARADETGQVSRAVQVTGRPGKVFLRLSDLSVGRELRLSAPWPARFGMILDPKDRRLYRNCPLSLGRLSGWRGVLPSFGGSLQIRAGATRIGFAVSGELQLAAYRELLGQVQSLTSADGAVFLRLVALARETPRLEIGRYDWISEDAGLFRHLGPDRIWLHAVCLDDPSRTANIWATGHIGLADWLGTEDVLWFIQGNSELRGVMRPFVWSPRPRPPSRRNDRILGFAEHYRALLEKPDSYDWDDLWQLIQAARGGGSAAALDQVQALGAVPAAAVVLLLRVRRAERAAVLALETEAPLWWPLVRGDAWVQAVRVTQRYLADRLTKAGLDAKMADQALAYIAGELVALRPELKAHLGQALVTSGLPAIALNASGDPSPLSVPSAEAQLRVLAQDAGRRFDCIPEGTRHIRAEHIARDWYMADDLQPLLDAPLVAAEVAAGLRAQPSLQDTLQLMALRAADPAWFDAALPAALTLALETSR